MNELTIKSQVVQFNFGLGFLREMNKKIIVPVEGMPGVKQEVGLRYDIARLIDGDVESLIGILDMANKGCTPRITRAELDAFVEDDGTDIDEVFEQVMGFLETANATRKTVKLILKSVEENTEKTS